MFDTRQDLDLSPSSSGSRCQGFPPACNACMGGAGEAESSSKAKSGRSWTSWACPAPTRRPLPVSGAGRPGPLSSLDLRQHDQTPRSLLGLLASPPHPSWHLPVRFQGGPLHPLDLPAASGAWSGPSCAAGRRGDTSRAAASFRALPLPEGGCARRAPQDVLPSSLPPSRRAGAPLRRSAPGRWPRRAPQIKEKKLLPG